MCQPNISATSVFFSVTQWTATHLATGGRTAREGWDVVVIPKAGVPAQEYADAGATWLIHTAQPTTNGWEATISEAVRGGPDRSPA